MVKIINAIFRLGNWLFEAVKLNKKTGSDKYKYGDHGIRFDSSSQFSMTDEIWGVDYSSSVYIDGKIKNILVFGEGIPQTLHNVTIIVEAKYPINFTE